MLPGETIASGAPNTCPECRTELGNQVLRSAAGFYVGTRCECGPYSRESGYYRTEQEAQRALDTGTFVRF
jgi:hypothetical protein